MNLLRQNQLLKPRDYFNNVWNQFLRSFEEEGRSDITLWTPAVDIKEENDRYVVCADLPGVEKNDIHVSLENNTLTIKGKRRYRKEEHTKDYFLMERTEGQFYRQFLLPETTDESKIQAKYKKGILEITIPKKESSRSKEIEVRIEE